jgi:hypothetical protein
MSKNKRGSRRRHSYHLPRIEVDGNPPRIVAMTLATEFADSAAVSLEERQSLIDTALCVGQWLADQGCPGRWDRVDPAGVLRCLDFISPDEKERFMFSLVALLGYAAINGLVAPRAAKRSIDEVAVLTRMDATRNFAKTAMRQIQSMTS